MVRKRSSKSKSKGTKNASGSQTPESMGNEERKDNAMDDDTMDVDVTEDDDIKPGDSYIKVLNLNFTVTDKSQNYWNLTLGEDCEKLEFSLFLIENVDYEDFQLMTDTQSEILLKTYLLYESETVSGIVTERIKSDLISGIRCTDFRDYFRAITKALILLDEKYKGALRFDIVITEAGPKLIIYKSTAEDTDKRKDIEVLTNAMRSILHTFKHDDTEVDLRNFLNSLLSLNSMSWNHSQLKWNLDHSHFWEPRERIAFVIKLVVFSKWHKGSILRSIHKDLIAAFPNWWEKMGDNTYLSAQYNDHEKVSKRPSGMILFLRGVYIDFFESSQYKQGHMKIEDVEGEVNNAFPYLCMYSRIALLKTIQYFEDKEEVMDFFFSGQRA